MEEKTTQEVAAIFAAAGDSVTVIDTAKTSDETDDEYKDKMKISNLPKQLVFPQSMEISKPAQPFGSFCHKFI